MDTSGGYDIESSLELEMPYCTYSPPSLAIKNQVFVYLVQKSGFFVSIDTFVHFALAEVIVMQHALDNNGKCGKSFKKIQKGFILL